MITTTIQTNEKRQVIDITDWLQQQLSEQSGSGILQVFVCHTTAALTTADLDPGTDQDFLDFLAAVTPTHNWRHPHNPAHAPDHMLASLIGLSISIPFTNDEL